MRRRKLRVGMIAGGGPANFFGGPHRRAILIDNSAELTAGALRSDPQGSLESARELLFLRGYPDWQTLIRQESALGADERVDYVTIVTPNDAHFGPADAASAAGIAVLCEKPLATEAVDPPARQAAIAAIRAAAPNPRDVERGLRQGRSYPANPKVGRCDWVRIDEVRDVGNNRGPEASNLVVVGPPQFAIMPDLGFAGPGLRVRQIPPGSLARTAGLKSDDVRTRLDGVEIKTIGDAQKVALTRILTMKKGDMVRGEYRRGEANHSFSFPVPELSRVPLFKRIRPAGRVDVSADGNRIDVTARAVARYTLMIRSEMFDLDRPIQAFTNGAESFNARVKPDLDFMLEQAGEDDDRSAVYSAKIEIQVLPGAARGRPRVRVSGEGASP
jgi:Oxidoreductase family, NAD-binding Rossmann fold